MNSDLTLPLAVILGPTAVGKSRLALSLAQAENMEIISADALQIYREMDIGTAKPSLAERALVPHHMIDIVSPAEHYSAGRYEREAGEAIRRVWQSGKIPLLVGGCGLYLRALLQGLCEGPEYDPILREKLRQEAQSAGREDYLHQKLKEIDPDSAQRLHYRDQPRLIRAIEVYMKTGIPLSVLQKRHSFPSSSRYRTKIIGLRRERRDLYARIEQRVDQMMEQGLVAEVKGLLEAGYSEHSTALQGLGYKQIVAALRGEYSLSEAARLIKRDSRHYAKRQFTWFGRMSDVHWIDLSACSEEEALRETKKVLAELI